MSYEKDKDPERGTAGNRDQFGARGRVATPADSPLSDYVIEPYARAVITGDAGDLHVVPVGNDDADVLIFTGVPVGFIPPYRVRIVKKETTCPVYTVEDFE